MIYTAAAANPTEEEARFAEASKDFAGLKRKYDISRNTVTRTDYEVDFITFYTRLADVRGVCCVRTADTSPHVLLIHSWGPSLTRRATSTASPLTCPPSCEGVESAAAACKVLYIAHNFLAAQFPLPQ